MQRILKLMLALVLFISLVPVIAVCAATSGKNPGKLPERVPAVMIGDRVVDLARNLGVLPTAMAARCMWPGGEALKAAVPNMGCPGKLKRTKADIPALVAGYGVNRIITERDLIGCYDQSAGDDRRPVVSEGRGLVVEYVDFSKGVVPAIRQMAQIIGKQKAGEALAARYNEKMKRVAARLPAVGLGKKVLILKGTRMKQSGKLFVQVETGGGFAEKYFLNRLGCTNIAKTLGITTKAKRPYVTIRNLKRFAGQAVDAIVIHGDTLAVQRFLRDQISKNPVLASMPAVKHLAIYSLPAYTGSSLIEFPDMLQLWHAALSG